VQIVPRVLWNLRVETIIATVAMAGWCGKTRRNLWQLDKEK
jgi:hypothetical protein